MKSNILAKNFLVTMLSLFVIGGFVLAPFEIAYSKVGAIGEPIASHITTLRKKEYYKINKDEEGFEITDQTLESLNIEGFLLGLNPTLKDLKYLSFTDENTFLTAVKDKIGEELTNKYKFLILKYADKKIKVADGPNYYHVNNSGALVGHYTTYGNHYQLTFGIDFDYMVEESYYVFELTSEYPISGNIEYYLDMSHGYYFGETKEVDVEIVQLPVTYNYFKDVNSWSSKIIKETIEKIKEKAEPVGTLKFGITQKGSDNIEEPLRNLINIKNLKDVEERVGTYYHHGFYAIKVIHSLDFSQCGGGARIYINRRPNNFCSIFTRRKWQSSKWL